MAMNRRCFVSALPVALLWSAKSAHASPSGLGIIFVAQSTCPYCAAVAPVLFDLHAQAGVDVIVASMDGRPVAPFEAFEDGHINPLTAGYATVPQVLIYSEKLDRITHQLGGFRTTRHFIAQMAHALRAASAL